MSMKELKPTFTPTINEKCESRGFEQTYLQFEKWNENKISKINENFTENKILEFKESTF